MSLLTRSTRSVVVLLSIAAGLAATGAQAATVSYQATFPLSPYLNSGTYVFPGATLPKFNLAGQCLSSVCVRLDGGLAGSIAFENYDNFPKTVNVTFTGKITLQRPDLSTLIIVQPVTGTTDNMPAFDGVLDYGGTSGKTYPNVGATQSDSTCTNSMTDLALFAGPGTITLPGFATDLSSQVGANSWSISVKAYATITVTYHYTECALPADRTTWGRLKGSYR